MKPICTVVLALVAAALTTGCLVSLATNTVTCVAGGCARASAAALTKNTASALGLEVDQFTISDRAKSGNKITYKVETKTGRKYNCYITRISSTPVSVSFSDAICSEIGEADEPSPRTESL